MGRGARGGPVVPCSVWPTLQRAERHAACGGKAGARRGVLSEERAERGERRRGGGGGGEERREHGLRAALAEIQQDVVAVAGYQEARAPAKTTHSKPSSMTENGRGRPGGWGRGAPWVGNEPARGCGWRGCWLEAAKE